MRYHPSDFDVNESEEDDEVVETSSGQSSQPPTLTSWKEELGQSIMAIETFGDVAWSKQYHRLVLPGLDVGGTPIPLPLVSPRDAEVIRHACHQAPFGRGDETVIDESVRKTWEIGQEGFNCLNPEWNKFVGSLLGEASVGLGMPHGVQARRYKLLLYDPGSFFKPHKDSEKAPGMIATVVICFPSVHEGGDVHLSHRGEKHTLVTSRSSAYDITALAWYSDVTHEVKEITAGHRLALTYNITLPKDQQNQASAAGLVEQQQQKHSFARAAKLREHIENRLSPDHFKFWTTKSRGGPHTLVVTKLETGHEADVKKHLTNIRNLEKRVQSYRIPWIKEILGEELYAELVLIEKIRTPPEDGAQPVPLVYKESDAAALPGVPAQASGNKRPASGNFEYPIASKTRVSNVVDLTEDD
ncbi:hypothetical protein PG987_007015 [Apiospora arundinis]